MIPQSIADSILHKFKRKPENISSVGGGSINQAFRLSICSKNYFLKFNDKKEYPKIIDHEKDGLIAIQKTQTIRVPEVIAYGETEAHEYLILPFIENKSRSEFPWDELGQKLAQMHNAPAPNYFGWSHDNYFGSMIQYNKPTEGFNDFWINQRIEPQLKQATDKQLLTTQDLNAFDSLFKELFNLFPPVQPSLVHGDLWNGNIVGNNSVGPYLIDPAIHYGHKESDIAFTYLFGGFGSDFYESYYAINPKIENFESRIDIYNLYPLLLHLNLFGSSYYSSIHNTLKQFL